MNNLSQIMISTILCLSTLTLAQDLINLRKQCTCDQLTSLFDCSYFSKCQFVNQVCSQKSCDQMNFEACQISDCTWNNGKCSEFTNCQDYKVSNDQDCSNLNHSCSYNSLTKTCQFKDQTLKSCSEQDEINCYYGIDGKCIYKDNKCQIWINCEDAEYEYCGYGRVYCIWNQQQNKCVSAPSCEQQGDELCRFASPQMNSYDVYICQQDENGNCLDFDASIQNQETCIIQSYGYYQWINGKCTSCQQINFELISQAFMLTLLFLS